MMMILALSLSYRSGSHPSSAALVIVLNMAFLSLIAPKHLKSAYDGDDSCSFPLRTPLAIVLNLAFLSLIAPKHLRSAYDGSLFNIIPTRTKIRVLRRSLLRLIMRKNYDLYGNEKGNPGFDAGNAGDQGGYTYFTSGPGQNGFNFRPNEWQNMGGGHGSSKSLSFSFGGPGGHSSFGFGLEDIFSNFFGGGGGQSESFSGLTRSESKSRSAPKSICAVANSLEGALKVGSQNCETESSFCKDLGVYPRRTPRVFVYSYKVTVNISQGFQNVLDLNHFEFSSRTGETLPKVLLLSTKIDTPVIWRVLSGLYCKRFVFYDAEVRDVPDPAVRRLGVDALPAVVGWLSNGEKHTLKTRISVKDIKSAVEDLRALLDGFEKRNKKAASSQA
ncbi:DnaJ protein ERDJ3A [Camellia lanceoleosa]|uniref:DnaJ protein ERDJ3A n=1 Tax=Camellia lanceoleosa TaxID=1840588 RepID=A0ACC0FRA6_9ERIC|nr:DnaJ protein ERDJ3A [Camellia lanceoleosa]